MYDILFVGVWGLGFKPKAVHLHRNTGRVPPPSPPSQCCRLTFVYMLRPETAWYPRYRANLTKALLTKRGSSSNITTKIDIVLNGFKVSTTNVTFVPEALEYVKDCFLELSDLILAHSTERFSTPDLYTSIKQMYLPFAISLRGILLEWGLKGKNRVKTKALRLILF